MIQNRMAQIQMDESCFQLTVQRNSGNIKAGHRPGPESFILKFKAWS